MAPAIASVSFDAPPAVTMVASLVASPSTAAAAARETFTNPVYEGADPWVVQQGGRYYLCQSEGDRGISVWASDRMTDPGTKRIVWKSPPKGWNSREVWAPELHWLDGKWYIYYAASDGRNANHRSGVLESKTSDPQGEYIDRGILYTGDDIEAQSDNRWSIDVTPVRINGKLYAFWSGWPAGDDVQYLYAARMENPWTISGDRVRLCDNCAFPWERVAESLRERGLHEGPQALQRDGRTFIVYSCSGSWEPSYKLGMIWLEPDADPLDATAWKRLNRPAMAGTEQVLGVGHCSFVRSPDMSEDWIIYHSKIDREHGWKRAVWMQPFTWAADGLPDFGRPVPAGKALPLPSGEPANRTGTIFAEAFSAEHWDHWQFFGYKRFIWLEDQRLCLGGRASWGNVNDYRSGEKALVRGQEWNDLDLQVRVCIRQGQRGAGVLFRVREPAVGYDAFKGYYAGLSPQGNKLVLVKSDGKACREIAAAGQPLDPERWYTLRVQAQGSRISISLDGKPLLNATDSDHATGRVGVRVIDTAGLFDDFTVRTLG